MASFLRFLCGKYSAKVQPYGKRYLLLIIFLVIFKKWARFRYSFVKVQTATYQLRILETGLLQQLQQTFGIFFRRTWTYQ